MKYSVIIVTLAIIYFAEVKSSEDNKGCFCPMIYNPICGSDGKTYSNNCVFNCASNRNPDLKVSHEGTCEKQVDIEEIQIEDLECRCPKLFSPVCGSDKIIYPNRCVFNCARRFKFPIMRILPMEDCNEIQNNCICTKEYDPFCGSDGVTYSNKCKLECEQRLRTDLEIINKGECLAKE